MASVLVNLSAVRVKYLRDEQAEFAIAQNGDSRALGNTDLIENFAKWPLVHCIDVISNPPRASSPLTLPSGHASGSAGNK